MGTKLYQSRICTCHKIKNWIWWKKTHNLNGSNNVFYQKSQLNLEECAVTVSVRRLIRKHIFLFTPQRLFTSPAAVGCHGGRAAAELGAFPPPTDDVTRMSPAFFFLKYIKCVVDVSCDFKTLPEYEPIHHFILLLFEQAVGFWGFFLNGKCALMWIIVIWYDLEEKDIAIEAGNCCLCKVMI